MLEIKTFDDAQVVLLRDKGNGRKELVATCTGISRKENAEVLATAEDRIGFKSSEQNAMADLCQLMSSVSWAVNGQGIDPSDSCVGDLESIAQRFASVNWGDMYDKFHRQGVNR